jgi:hypothetical protein
LIDPYTLEIPPVDEIMAESPSELRIEIEKLERKHAENPEGRYFVPLANAYRKLGAAEHAESLLRDGLRRHPDYLSAHVVLGRCLADQRASEAAVEEFRYVLSVDPHNLIALRSLAELARADRRTDEAVHWYRELAAVDPMNDEARRALEELGAFETPEPPAPLHAEPSSHDDWLHPSDEFGLDQPLPMYGGDEEDLEPLVTREWGGLGETEVGDADEERHAADGEPVAGLETAETAFGQGGYRPHEEEDTSRYEPVPGFEASGGRDQDIGSTSVEPPAGYESAAERPDEGAEHGAGTYEPADREDAHRVIGPGAGLRGEAAPAELEHRDSERDEPGDEREAAPLPAYGEREMGSPEEEAPRAEAGEPISYAGFSEDAATEEMEDVLAAPVHFNEVEERADEPASSEGDDLEPGGYEGDVLEDEDEGAGALATETIAELYARQGFYERSADVLREVIRRRGGDEALERRLEEIQRLAGGGEAPSLPEGSSEETGGEAGRPEHDRAAAAEEMEEEPEPWAADVEAAETREDAAGEMAESGGATIEDEDAFADSFAHGFHAPAEEVVEEPTAAVPPATAVRAAGEGATIAVYLRELAAWRHGDEGPPLLQESGPVAALPAAEQMTDAEDVAAIWSPEGEAAHEPAVSDLDDTDDVAAIWAPDGESASAAAEELDPWEATPASAAAAPHEPVAEEVGTGSAADEPYPWEEPGVEEPAAGAGDRAGESAAAAAGLDEYIGQHDRPAENGVEHARSLDHYLPYDEEPVATETATQPERVEASPEDAAPPAGAPTPGGSQDDDDDLESFQTWLRSLKR